MKWLVLITLLTSALAQAASHPLLNDREGKSSLLTSSQLRNIERMPPLRSTLEEDYKAALAEMKGEACAFTLNQAIFKRLPNHPMLGVDKENMLRAIRLNGLMDDMTLQILLRAAGVQKDIQPNLRDTLNAPATVPNELKPMREFALRRSRGKCLHDNFREMLSSYRQINSNYTPAKVRALLPQALKLGAITDKGVSELQELITDGVEKWELSLADYVGKRDFLRNQFKVNESERSNFVTKPAPKSSVSYRMRLYTLYTPIQITLMGNIIKKLKARLESPKIEILVYEHDESTVQEVISLDPMERFRFAIRLLRKEMKLLGTNSYFTGRSASYIDLLSASYEIGLVTGSELDQMGELEEIWNPHETFWDKANQWIRLFGGVLSVAVPPPYGFIPAMALTAIEMLNHEAPNDDQDSLF